MTEPVTLEDIKTHLRMSAGVTAEDLYLQDLILAARRMIERDTQRTIVGEQPSISGDDLAIACHAIRLLVGHWYLNRESATDGRMAEMPLSVTWITDSLRTWHDGSEA